MNGFSNASGRVLVLINGEWGTVCDKAWELEEATVVCKQLGYPDVVLSYTQAYFGEGSGRIWLSNVECNGDEVSLLECKHERFLQPDCNHTHDVGVFCGGKKGRNF